MHDQIEISLAKSFITLLVKDNGCYWEMRTTAIDTAIQDF